MRWPFRKQQTEANRRAEQAAAEAEQARERLERSRKEVVKPLRQQAAHNQFADIIRKSLLDGK